MEQIESAGHRGGLRLGGLGPSWPLVSGRFPLAAAGGRAGTVHVGQSADRIELWFGSGPLTTPASHRDTPRSIAVWLERGLLVGLSMGYASLAVAYPIEAIELSAANLA